MKKKNLISMIENSTCSFTCIKYLKELLIQNDFQELKETDNWDLGEGNFFVTRNDASIIAFKIPKKANHFQIVASHSDTPSLLLKPNGENIKEGYLKHNVMPYGGLLNYGFLDHPLSIAGRVTINKDNTFYSKIIDFQKPFAVIPSVAIHQNDKANSNLDLNMQVDLQPIFGISENKSDWHTLLVNQIGLKNNELLGDYDLFLYNPTPPMTFGINDELLLSPRIDNITSVSASFYAFLESKNNQSINVFTTFNNEEIGSLTKEGADSNFLLDTLKKITALKEIDFTQTLAKSFIISADNTHAVHPNHQEFMDETGNLYFNKGFAIVKETNSTTESLFSSIIKEICQKKKIKYQDSTAKNDLAGGQTLSGLSLRHVSITSIDVGIAELAMHSSLEVCSLIDYDYLYKMLKEYYNTNINYDNEKITLT